MPVVDGVGSSAGIAFAQASSHLESGSGPFNGVGASAGAATVVGFSTSEGVGAAAGAATVAGFSATNAGVGVSAGSASVSGFSQAPAAAVAENPKTYTLRVRDVRIGANGIVEFDLVREDISIYYGSTESPLLGGDVAGGGPPPPEDPNADNDSDASQPGTSRVVMLDIPQLLPEHNSPGFYAAASGTSAGWDGALLYRKDGSEYVEVAQLGDRAIIGRTDTKLQSGIVTLFDASGRTFQWDNTNTVDVTLSDDVSTLASVSDADVLAGRNIAAIGAHGRWEIVGFGTVTQLATRKYRLSHLLRGLKGTEWATTTHWPGDQFVVLGSALRRVSQGYEDIGVARSYRAVSIGNALDTASDFSFTNSGVSLKPLAPVYIRGEEDPDDNKIIYWWDRSRLDGLAGRDGTAAPPADENPLNYEVDILNGAGTTVLRTINVVGEAALYTATQQRTDHGSIPTTLNVKIYKISPTLGRGYVGSATLSSFAAGEIPDDLATNRPYRVKCTARAMIPGGILVNDPVTDVVLFPAGLPQSRGVVRTAPAAEAVFSLQKNDVEFGTMTFSAGQTVAVFASSADITLDPEDDDILTVVAPTPADTSLRNLGFTLHGERQ